MTGADSRHHIVNTPQYFLWLRYAQILFAVIVLALSSYAISNDFFGLEGYAIFVSIATLIIMSWFLISFFTSPVAYNCWAVLVLECFQVIWWLSAWASLAAWAAAYSWTDSYLDWDDYYYGSKRSLMPRALTRHNWRTQRNVLGAAAGIGALNWVLFITTLVVYSINLHRHRRSGAPYSSSGQWRANGQGVVTGPQSDKDAQQYQMQPQYQQYPQQV